MPASLDRQRLEKETLTDLVYRLYVSIYVRPFRSKQDPPSTANPGLVPDAGVVLRYSRYHVGYRLQHAGSRLLLPQRACEIFSAHNGGRVISGPSRVCDI